MDAKVRLVGQYKLIITSFLARKPLSIMAKQKNFPSDDFENFQPEESLRASSDDITEPDIEPQEVGFFKETDEDDATALLRHLQMENERLRRRINDLEGESNPSADYGKQIVDQLKKLVKAENQETNHSYPTSALKARLNVLLNSYPKTWQ